MRQELAAAGRDLKPVQSVDDHDLERELARWLSSTRESDAEAGYRAGWRRFGQLAAPRIQEWERLWWRSKREGDSLRSRRAELLMQLWQLSNSG